MRELLIEILKTAKDSVIDLDLPGIADALIKTGVLLPKFKVGQEIWYLVQGEIYSSAVLAVEFWREEIYYTLEDEWGGVEHEFYSTEAEARAVQAGGDRTLEVDFDELKDDDYWMCVSEIKNGLTYHALSFSQELVKILSSSSGVPVAEIYEDVGL